MSSMFDDLARGLGGATSRRQALLSMVGILAGAFTGCRYKKQKYAHQKDCYDDDFCTRYCSRCSGYSGHKGSEACCGTGEGTSNDFCICWATCTTCKHSRSLCGYGANTTCCQDGATCCGATVATGTCVNTHTDSSNCGACGHDCAKYYPHYVTPGCCNGHCTDLASDNAHCGACDHHCPAGSVCTGGKCVSTTVCTPPCTGDKTCCSGHCVDMNCDGNNCGACGKTCGANQKCIRGSCVSCYSDA